MTRILFVTDFHGSLSCWLKSLTTIDKYNVDVALMSGDLTAKAIVPILDQGSGKFKFKFLGKWYKVKKEEDLKKHLYKIKSYGFYPYICTEEESSRLAEDRSMLLKLFDKLAVDTMKEWLELAEERVGNKVENGDLKLIVMPGNDDSFVIDEVIKKSKVAIYPLDKVLDIDEHHQMISFDHVNPTPWDTPREATEDELRKMLEKLFNKVDDYTNLIFQCHCPPYDSGLDSAPKLDEKMTPIYSFGQPVMIPVGSKAVREVVEKYQPKLGLFGHIHEAYGFTWIGRTLCLNPGSEYDRGIFKGYLIDLTRDKIEKFWRVEG